MWQDGQLSIIIPLITSFVASLIFFTLFHILGPRYIPIPPLIRAIDDKTKKYDAFRRYVAIYSSTVHGVFCILLLGAFVCKDGIVFDKPNETYHYFFIGFSFGYYLVDTIAGCLFNFGGGAMAFHHIIMILIFTYLCIKRRYAGLFSYLTFLGELSNPFMHVRKNMMQFENTRLYTNILGIVFCITYIFCRVVMIGLSAQELAESTMTLGFKLLVCSIWYFSLYWSVNVAVLLFKGLSEAYPHPIFKCIYDTLEYIETNKATRVLKHFILFYKSFVRFRHSQHTEFF